MADDDMTPSALEVVSAERLTFFSDAVVAIAITLLALDLPVPADGTDAEVWDALREARPEYLAFLISFLVVWSHWQGHHRLFRYVDRLGGRITQWTMVWLLMIVVTPFATRTLTLDGAFRTRFTLYAAVQALSGLAFLMIARDITRHGLLVPGTPAWVLRRTYARSGGLVLAFTISIPVAFLTHWAYACWVAIPFGWSGLEKYLDRRNRRAVR